MWLPMLINKYPALALRIKQELLKYVRETERKARATQPYWYRALRPNDPEIGGTVRIYTDTFTNNVERRLFGAGAAFRVPTANAYVCFGWYIDFDPGPNGYVKIEKQGVPKQEIPARIIYNSPNPKHMFLDFDHVIFGQEEDMLNFLVYNNAGHDQVGMALPIMFRIASRSALNLDVPL